jgi:hypothetical protein
VPASETHAVEIAGVERRLRLYEVAPGVRIAVICLGHLPIFRNSPARSA